MLITEIQVGNIVGLNGYTHDFQISGINGNLISLKTCDLINIEIPLSRIQQLHPKPISKPRVRRVGMTGGIGNYFQKGVVTIKLNSNLCIDQTTKQPIYWMHDLQNHIERENSKQTA